MGFFKSTYSLFQRWFWISLSIAIPALGLSLSIVYWDSLTTDNESASSAIRNVGLVIAGSTALPLAIWRGLVAQKQADAAQQSLRNERYQKGAEMLGDEQLSVRLGGIYALENLAKEHREEYHINIMRLFCAFVRHPTRDTAHVKALRLKIGEEVVREDIQAIVDMICKRDQLDIALESEARFIVDLPIAHLRHARMNRAKLVRSIFWKTDLSHAILWNAYLSSAILSEANLSSADLKEATLSKADLRGAHLCKAQLAGTILAHAKVQEADLSGAKIWGTDFSHANLNDANLSHTEIWAAKFPGTFLHGANLTQADLKHIDMSNGKLAEANLSNAKAQGMNLSGANLRGSDLSSADMRKANLSTTKFWAATLTNTLLDDANLSGADFSGIRTPTSPSSVIGLTQAQLNNARAHPKPPPKLKGALNAVTGKQLCWTGGRGAPLNDEA